MTYIVDFTDDEGKRRTVTVESRYDLLRGQFRETIAAYCVESQLGYVIKTIHTIKEQRQ